MKRLLMKKYLIVIAAAAMLAGCAKNEVVTPDGNAPAEITFTTAPVTKADSFDEDNVFETYAVYTAGDYSYSTTASWDQFITFSTVRYSNRTWRIDSDNDGDIDSDDTSYFWPKDGGKLSFFSWSLNTGELTFADGTEPNISFANTQGLSLYNYVSGNDFMVADPALNKIENSYYTYDHIGVPTLFRHKAAQIIFYIKTAQDYGKTFKLKSIAFENVSTTGSYTQGSDPTGSPSTEAWDADDSYETTYYYNSARGWVIPAITAEAVPANGTAILIPQSFSDTDGKNLILTYTITSGTTTQTKIATVKMNTLLGGSSSQTTALQKGKKYTITLSISSGNEILWTPEVVDWVDEAKTISVTES